MLAFRASDRLAAAYGIAVTGTMAITSIIYYIVTRRTWHWPRWKAIPLLVIFLCFDLAFFGANLFKFVAGGYVPMLIGAGFVAAMLIWSKGRTLEVEELKARLPKQSEALAELAQIAVARVPGTAVFLTSLVERTPPSLSRYVERGRALHETVILLTVEHVDAPVVAAEQRTTYTELEFGFHRVVIRVGYTEQPPIHDIVTEAARTHGLPFTADAVTYYLHRETILASSQGRMGRIAESLFAYLQRNAVAADREFKIPPAQIVEIGTQIDL